MWKIIIFFIIISYFIYHIVSGQRGMLSLIDINKQISERQEILNRLVEERITVERKIECLSNNYDRDLIDELARGKISVAIPDENVLIIEEEKLQ